MIAIATLLLIVLFEAKGQFISKCPFGVFESATKPRKFLFKRISALASKKRSDKKIN